MKRTSPQLSQIEKSQKSGATLALAALAAVALGSSAFAQVNYRVLAVTGDPIESRNGTVRFGSVADSSINNLNQVAYRGILFGRGLSALNNDAVVLQRLFRRTGRVVASEGDIITAGYMATGQQTPTTSKSTTAAGITTTIETFQVVVQGRLGTGDGVSTFGNRIGLTPEGVVVFPSTTTASLGTQTITTVVDDATGAIISQVGTFDTADQNPLTLFASNGATPIPLISVTTQTDETAPTLGPAGLANFGAGQFKPVAGGDVSLSGSFYGFGVDSLAPRAGQAKFNLNAALAGGEVSLDAVVIAGDRVAGLPLDNSPTFGTSEVGLQIVDTTLPGLGATGISSAFISTDSQTVDDIFGPGSGDSNRFRGIWNFINNGAGFFIGRGSPAVDFNGQPGLFSSFGGTDAATPEGLPLTVAAATSGLICFTATILNEEGAEQPQALYFTRVRLNGSNIQGTPATLTGQGPNADLQLPYIPNGGKAFESVRVGFEVLVNTAFPNPNRGGASRAPLTFIGQPGINNRGTIVFQGGVSVGTGVLNPVYGIWAIPFGALQAGSREPVCIALEGDIITINGRPRKVVALRFNPYNGLNDFNRVVYTVSFDDASSAVMFANIQPNSGRIQ